jgi:hypothetical protein
LRYLKEGEEEAAAAATARKPRQQAKVPDGAEEEEATAADFGRGKGGARAVVERFIVTSRTLERGAVHGLTETHCQIQMTRLISALFSCSSNLLHGGHAEEKISRIQEFRKLFANFHYLKNFMDIL